MFFVFHASVFPHYGLLSLYVCISHILPAVTNESFSCGLNASCIEILNAQVCVPPRHGVYPAPQLAESAPPHVQPGVHVHTYLYLYMCVCLGETDREVSLMVPCCHWRKPIMGHAGVSGTPPTNIIHTHSFSTHLYGCDRKAASLLFPPAIWRPSKVLPPLAWYEIRLCSPCHFFSFLFNGETDGLAWWYKLARIKRL